MHIRFLAFMFALVWGGTANAVTLEFKNILSVPFDSNVYVEAGFRVEGLNEVGFGGFDGEHIHIDVFGVPYSHGFRLESIGAPLFSVFALDILVYANATLDAGIAVLSFTGFRAGAAVATATSFVGTLSHTLFFGPEFQNIDGFLMTTTCIPVTGLFCGPQDVHFNVDNIVATPIPLPAAGLLLLGALGLITGFSRRAR